MTVRRLLGTLIVLLGLGRAEAAPTAREVVEQARHLAQTTRKWSDRSQHLQLTINRRGGERHREMSILLKKYLQDRNRTLLFFVSPPEVKGVGFLQWADPHAKDEQWLYLPELKRVRQISGGAKHESFAGTDFSYDDLAIISEILDWTDQDATLDLLRDEPVNGQPAHVIGFTPTGKDLTYGKVLTWLTTSDLVLQRFEMYDKSGRLEKELALTDFRAVGTVPTPFHMEMKNVLGGSRTVVDFTAITYDSGLSDETVNAVGGARDARRPAPATRRG